MLDGALPAGSGGSQRAVSPADRQRASSGVAAGRLVRSLSEGSLAPSLLAVELPQPPLRGLLSRSMNSLRGRGETAQGLRQRTRNIGNNWIESLPLDYVAIASLDKDNNCVINFAVEDIRERK